MKYSLNGASIRMSGIPACTHHRLTDAGGSTSEVVAVRSFSGNRITGGQQGPQTVIRRYLQFYCGSSECCKIRGRQNPARGSAGVISTTHLETNIHPCDSATPLCLSEGSESTVQGRQVRCERPVMGHSAAVWREEKSMPRIAVQRFTNPLWHAAPLRSRTAPNSRMKFSVGSASGQAGTGNRAFLAYEIP